MHQWYCQHGKEALQAHPLQQNNFWCHHQHPRLATEGSSRQHHCGRPSLPPLLPHQPRPQIPKDRALGGEFRQLVVCATLLLQQTFFPKDSQKANE